MADLALKLRLGLGLGLLVALPVLCLEKTTGEARPLDPRFTAGGGDGGSTVVEHDPNAGPAEPFADLGPGESVVLVLQVTSETEEPVDVDLLVPDSTMEGGFANAGKVLMEGPDELSLRVPRGLGPLVLLAFQDLDSNGPSDSDPFAGLTLEVGEVDQQRLSLDLIVGGRAAFALQGASSRTAFPEHEGQWTHLIGSVESPLRGSIAVDFLVPDASSQAGVRFLAKTLLSGPGHYNIAVPQGLGELTVQFFQDATGDGPDATDPFAQVVIQVEDQEELALDLVLEPGGFLNAATPSEGGGGPGPSQGVFDELGDSPVTLSGELVLEGGLKATQVAVDVYRVDPGGHGGRSFLKKIYLVPGAFSIQAPSGYGGLLLEASIDPDGDGPTPGDPQGACEQNPVMVGSKDLDDLRIVVAPPE